MTTFAVSYPAALPGPISAPFTPATRIRRSDIATGPAVQAARERDFRGTQQLVFTFTADEAQRFDDWWRLQLGEGGLSFSAEWPLPLGFGVARVRRFTGAPAWALVSGGADRRIWRVSVTSEVFGRHLAPQGDDTLLGLPEWYLFAEYLDRAIAALPRAEPLFTELRPWYPWGEQLDSAIAALPTDA